jgi:hypothetical protein
MQIEIKIMVFLRKTTGMISGRNNQGGEQSTQVGE